MPASSMLHRTRRNTATRSILVVLVIALLAVPGPPPVYADAPVVSNANDSGPGSLRQAIDDALEGEAITFADHVAGQTILLESVLDIYKDLTIDGSGLNPPLRISGQNAVTVFSVGNSRTVTLKALTITQGNRGIYNSGTLTVSGCTLSDNSALGEGGAILNNLGLVVEDSTFTGNTASHGGAINNNELPGITVTNSTFSGNSASMWGGAIMNWHYATVTGCTLTGNNSPDGSGIHNYGSLSMTNTILADPPEGQVLYDGHGGFGYLNYQVEHLNASNLVEDGSVAGALTGDPGLSALGDHAGRTQTFALLPGSPAVNAGDADHCPATDQRGVVRPQGDGCDIGAYEMRPPAAATLSATDITSSGATLQGSAATSDAGASVWFEYGPTPDREETATADPASVAAGEIADVSATLTGLHPNITYHYRVTAENDAGIVYGEDATLTTQMAPPTAVTGVAEDVTPSGATLRGTVNAQNDETAVTFEYGLNDAYGETAAATPGAATGLVDTAVSAALTDLLPNTTYHYRVTATNGAGTTPGADATFTTDGLAPLAVTLPATGATEGAATLHGTVTAHNDTTAVSFRYGLTPAYGSEAPADPATVAGMQPIAVSQALEGLVPNATYHYQVVAENATGTTHGEDMTFSTLPAAPTAMTQSATDIAPTAATLRGTVNAQNADAAVTFEYGLTAAYGQTVDAAPATVTGVEDAVVTAALADLAPATAYHYRVVAENATGLATGEDMTFTTLAPPLKAVYLPLVRR